MIDVASYIDHTILKPTTTPADIRQLCNEAAEYKFAAVCVPPPFVKNAVSLLKDTDVQVATVVGFPFGYSVARAKLEEVNQAIADGAKELDVVVNISALKSGSWKYLESEVRLLLSPIHSENRAIKIIIESGVLTDEEIISCCKLYGDLGVDYLKTSTGYAESGASRHAVQLMKQHLPSHVKIKASGGIRTYDAAVQFIEAGASRIGCSASVKIASRE